VFCWIIKFHPLCLFWPITRTYIVKTVFALCQCVFAVYLSMCCRYCRLQVVSTSVGGVPEVLPPHLIRLTEPSAKGSISVSMKYCIELSISYRHIISFQYRSSVLRRCRLRHLTRKNVSEMSHNVSSGTLNPTIPIPFNIIFYVKM